MSTPRSPRHIAALNYVQAGIPVFALLPGEKIPPLGSHAYKDSTTDADQINAWWSEADYNIGFCPATVGWCVIEYDVRNGKRGDKNWEALQEENGAVPETFTVRSPSGGRHLYFIGELGPSASKLAEHVDTRGSGSHVLLPPSVYGGHPYTVEKDVDPAELPGWIADRVKRRAVPVEAVSDDLDTKGNIFAGQQLLEAYVRNEDFAITGKGGDQRTYEVACGLFDKGLSSGKVYELIQELWNPHCRPPWDPDELIDKIENAQRYKQNETGSQGAVPAAEVFKGAALDKLPSQGERQEPPLSLDDLDKKMRASRYWPKDVDEQEEGPDPTWLIPNLIPEATSCLLVAPSGSYKSFIALDVALSIANRVETFGTSPLLSGPVFYATSEGRISVEKARRRAWETSRGINRAEYRDKYFTMAGPLCVSEPEIQEWGDLIKYRVDRYCAKEQPKLIVIDTLARAMAGMNENDAQDAGKFVQLCDSLIETFGCSTLVLHHTGKDESRGARGSSALVAGFGTTIEAKAYRDVHALEVRVNQHKDAEEPENPWTFRVEKLGQGAVLVPTTRTEHRALTSADGGITSKKIAEALRVIKAVGIDNSVSSIALARVLVPASGDHDETERLVAAAVKSLTVLAKDKFDGQFCQKLGREWVWFREG